MELEMATPKIKPNAETELNIESPPTSPARQISLSNENLMTATKYRQWIAREITSNPSFDKELAERIIAKQTPALGSAENDTVIVDHDKNIRYSCALLKQDVLDIIDHRQQHSDPICIESLQKWFPEVTTTKRCLEILTSWIDTKRDFIYNTNGLRLLQNRYLRPNEPIQYCMLRIAKLFISKLLYIEEDELYFEEWRLMYDTISCGFMQVSSILADSDQADPDSAIIPGEACRLIIAHPGNDRKLVMQANHICDLVSLGVGIGIGATTIRQTGFTENGKVRGGFLSFAKKMDSCNYLSIYERKPKVAIYIGMHNDTIYDAFELKNPMKEHLENIFPGIMIPDYFIECYEKGEPWYLFPGDTRLNGKTLCDYSGEEYRQKYKEFVAAKLYTRIVSSTKLMNDLVTCITETGSPYIIWSDRVNEFSNHRHLGTIKTLNLCAEITNFSSVERSSSCTLISMNFAMHLDFPEVLERIYTFVRNMSKFKVHNYCGIDDCEERNGNISKFAYALGFMGTWALNNLMGNERKQREIGVNPMGVYDMAVLLDLNPTKLVGRISEELYKGCIEASCQYHKLYDVTCEYYKNSPFSKGRPQWALRSKAKSLKSNWSVTQKLMTEGMANSMLTAQAPTATTSMLTGSSESVTLPIDLYAVRESENGRNVLICYGLLTKILNNQPIHLHNCLDNQILMYSKSAPFIDQSQSTMFSLEMSRQKVLNLIMDTYYAGLKTGIYYTQPKQMNNTLTIVRDLAPMQKYYSTNGTKRKSNECDDDDKVSASASNNTPKRQRPMCEGCSA